MLPYLSFVLACFFAGNAQEPITNNVMLITQSRIHQSTYDSEIIFEDNEFLDADGQWTDHSTTWIWDKQWSEFNCYAFAIQRFDEVPWYYDCVFDARYQRGYSPGQFQGWAHGITRRMALSEAANLVKEDLETIGYQDVSAFRLGRSLPQLGENDHLIAMRTGTKIGFDGSSNFDYHFMVYNQEDGYWYQKFGSSAPLRHKYQLSESRSWKNESLLENAPSYYGSNEVDDYTSDIWLIKYTDACSFNTFAGVANSEVFVVNSNDVLGVVRIEERGSVNISFDNVNGFIAKIYTSDWDEVLTTTYGPICESLPIGDYYLVMMNVRYNDYVYIDFSFVGDN